MKTLHLAIIVGFLVVITGIAFNAYGACAAAGSNGMNICETGLPAPITVTTNLQNYTVTDKIIISGHISNPNGRIPLVIKIFDPHHQEVVSKFLPLWSNKNYTWIVSPVAFYFSGNYTALAQYGQNIVITHFFLNYNIDQYLQTISPLKQRKMFPGTLPQDFHCGNGFQLVLKAEDFSPACVHPFTATELIMRGWAFWTNRPEPFIKKIEIIGLQQNYTVGQPINATVSYTGYYWYTEPDVKIFDSNYTQVWYNCPNCDADKYTMGGGPPILAIGSYAYQVREPNGLPIINHTGTYTMVASLDNKTTQQSFNVIRENTIPFTPLKLSGN